MKGEIPLQLIEIAKKDKRIRDLYTQIDAVLGAMFIGPPFLNSTLTDLHFALNSLCARDKIERTLLNRINRRRQRIHRTVVEFVGDISADVNVSESV